MLLPLSTPVSLHTPTDVLELSAEGSPVSCSLEEEEAETKRIKYRHQSGGIKLAPRWPLAKFSIRVSCKSSLAVVCVRACVGV